jgi:hypothetical protein
MSNTPVAPTLGASLASQWNPIDLAEGSIGHLFDHTFGLDPQLDFWNSLEGDFTCLGSPLPAPYESAGSECSFYTNQASNWEPQGRVSPETYLDDYVASPSPTDYAVESSSKSSKSKGGSKGHCERRPSNRDEFDGPH